MLLDVSIRKQGDLGVRMGGSRFGWAVGAIAPWWLGVALAVAMPVGAGQDQRAGASLAPLTRRAPPPPDDLVPAQLAGLRADFAGLAPRDPVWDAVPRLLREASLSIGAGEAAMRLADEIAPRAAAKRAAGAPPAIDRAHKGDPAAGVEPTFDARLRRSGGLASLRAHDLLFEHDADSPVGALDDAGGEFAGPDSVAAFEPWADGETPTTAPSAAAASASQPGGQSRPGASSIGWRAGASTMRPLALSERLMQGATPAVRRADALGSTTPAAAAEAPVEAAAALASARPEGPNERPAGADVAPAPRLRLTEGIDAAERRCLAEAVYFEARGESKQGQAAVAQVVLNRAASGLYPPSICGVVYQNRRRHNACQFSFACDGRSLRVAEPEAWRTAARIADEVSTGATYLADVGGSTHYHASYVRPRWARSLEKMDVIGRHIFYRLRPGQT